MYSKFESLAEEKRKRIIEACTDEFSRHGYTNASTNTIVKNAGISKGILFHYFKNKKGIYLYVMNYVADFMTGLFHQWMTDVPSEFFERMEKIAMLKLKAVYEYPSFYKLMIDSYTHVPAELKNEMQKRYDGILKDNLPLLFKDLDMSKFRKDIDPKKTVELVMFALEGLSGKYLKIFESMDYGLIMSRREQLYAEYREYTDILKKVMYT